MRQNVCVCAETKATFKKFVTYLGKYSSVNILRFWIEEIVQLIIIEIELFFKLCFANAGLAYYCGRRKNFRPNFPNDNFDCW